MTKQYTYCNIVTFGHFVTKHNTLYNIQNIKYTYQQLIHAV